LAKKIQPKQSNPVKKGGTTKRDSRIGDSKGSMENLRKAMEIPPKTTSSDKPKKK
jgi:hypothetical protein